MITIIGYGTDKPIFNYFELMPRDLWRHLSSYWPGYCKRAIVRVFRGRPDDSGHYMATYLRKLEIGILQYLK